jgi:acetyltransferase-like isoleucine patch superfamily enzyme
MSHLTSSMNVQAPPGCILGSITTIDDAPSVLLVNFYGSKGCLDPGWYFINSMYERFGIPFAGPFSSSDEATKAWKNHLRHMGVTRPLLFVGHNSIVFDPVVLVNSYSIYIGSHARVDSFVKIEGGQGVHIGDHVHIASFAHIGIGGGVTILEEGSSVGSGGRIMSGSNMPDAVSCSATALPENQRQEKHVTRIAKNATVYAGATILPGLTIGEGARIAAGAVVLKNVPPFETWAGVPARRVK